MLRAWKRPLRRQSGGGFGRAQKPGAPASAAANRCFVFQGLVDEREWARALKDYCQADAIKEQLDKLSVVVVDAERFWSSASALCGPVPSPMLQSDTLPSNTYFVCFPLVTRNAISLYT